MWLFYPHPLLGLIFVVDSNDRERIGEAREELFRMLNEDELRDAALLVFANKQVSNFFLDIIIYCLWELVAKFEQNWGLEF